MAQTVEDSLVVRMEATLRKFERQMDGGRKAAVRAATGAEQAWKRSGTQITANANRAATGLGRLSNVSGSSRFVLQNTANQIGDMAIQLEGGTNAFRVMGQQIPQVLGGFGALGGALGVLGPLLGTVAALGLPLAAMYFTMGEDAEEAADKTKTFADRLSEAESAIAALDSAVAQFGTLEGLREKYGEITEEVRELALELLRMEERAAKLKVGAVIDDITGSIESAVGAVGAVDLALSQVGTEEAREQIARLQQDIEAIEQRREAGLFVDQAELNLLAQMREELAALQGDFTNLGSLADDVKLPPELLAQLNQAQAALQAAQDAGDFGAVADQWGIIRDLVREAGNVFEDGFVAKLNEAESLARETAKDMDDARKAAEGIESVDLASAIGGGADAAKRMAEELGVALEVAQKLQGLGRGTPDGEVIFDPRDPNFDPVLAALARANEGPERLFENGPSRSPRSSRSRGGGGSSAVEPDLFASAEKQLESLNRQIEMIGKTQGEVAELTAKYKLLDEAKKRGLDLDKEQIGTGETLRQEIERQAGAIGDLSQRYEDARSRAAFFEQQQDSVKNGMLDAIVEGENLAGVLADVAKSFARASLEAALFGTGPFSSGGGGGGGGLLSGLFSGIAGGFDSGGTIPAGKVGAVAGFGAELLSGGTIVRGPARVTSRADTARMMGGGSMTNLQVNIVNEGGQRLEETGRERRRGPNGQEVIDIAVSDSISSGKQDGVFKSRFGAQTQTVKR